MTVRVKVSSKNQIAVPAEARKQLGIKSGDTLLVDVSNGRIILSRQQDDPVGYLRGLHKEVWEGIEPQDYVDREREAWNR